MDRQWKTPLPPVIWNDASSCASVCAATWHRAAEVRGPHLLRRQGSRQPALLPLQGQEHFLLQFLDGKHTLDDAQKAYEQQLPPRPAQAGRPGRLRPAAAHRRPGPERVAAGRQAALRPPQEAPPQRMDADAHQHPLHQDPDLRSGQAARRGCCRYCGWIFTHLVLRRSASAFMLAAVLLVATHFETFREQAARLPRVLQLQDRRLPVGWPWASSRSSTSSATA